MPKENGSSPTTLSVKVPKKFAENFRSFCNAHSLQVGKFAENALSELMEDYHFGQKAQKVLSEDEGGLVSHQEYFKA